jgi:NitT/TauT family transport system permease protein
MKNSNTKQNSLITSLWFVLGILILLAVWEIASLIVASEMLIPGPLPTMKQFFWLVATERFLVSLAHSCLRVLIGMAISVPLGVLAGTAAGLDKHTGALLKPLFQVISATPVMSIILIAFLWFGQEQTPIFTAFLVIFPLIAANTIAGINAIDPKLKELCTIYRLSTKERFFSLHLPGIAPFILGGLRSGLSLCWKVVVAAEVLLQPQRALGTGMQGAKAYLETAELFAWTAAAIIAAALSQFLLSLIIKGIKYSLIRRQH